MAKKLEEYIAADKREDPLSQLARVRAEMEAEDRANRERGEREREEAARREREANEAPAPPRVDPHHLQQLCDMGFTRTHAEEALEACGNDLNSAMEWILTHPSSEVCAEVLVSVLVYAIPLYYMYMYFALIRMYTTKQHPLNMFVVSYLLRVRIQPWRA